MTSTRERGDEDALPWDALPWAPSPSIVPDCFDPGNDGRLIRAMIGVLIQSQPRSDAEALQFLRRRFPGSPLATRIAAFAARYKRNPGTRFHMPR
jgi:hypothetical protein